LLIHVENAEPDCLGTFLEPANSEIEPVAVALCVVIGSQVKIEIMGASLHHDVKVSAFELTIELPLSTIVHLVLTCSRDEIEGKVDILAKLVEHLERIIWSETLEYYFTLIFAIISFFRCLITVIYYLIVYSLVLRKF